MDVKQDNQFGGYQPYGGSQQLPNSVATLVLGIVSIAMCWCYGLVSIITGTIALILASQAEKVYQANPQVYTESSYKNMKAGKICAIVGLCLGVLYLLFVIVYLVIFGAMAFNNLGKFKF